MVSLGCQHILGLNFMSVRLLSLYFEFVIGMARCCRSLPSGTKVMIVIIIVDAFPGQNSIHSWLIVRRRMVSSRLGFTLSERHILHRPMLSSVRGLRAGHDLPL
jgi:hypothetical protein